MRKKLRIVCFIGILIVLATFALTGCTSSSSGRNQDGYYTPSDREMEDAREDANAWMNENW